MTTATAETVQAEGARGVWDGATLTIYPTKAGNTALKFANSLVNVTATADGNKVNTPTITMLTHGLTDIHTTTNAGLLNDHYLTATGTGLVYAGNKVFSVDVKEQNNQYVKTISAGVPAITLDLSGTGTTYAEAMSTLSSVEVFEHPTEQDQLIIYADGTGVSEIAVTAGSDVTIYQTKASATAIDVPTVAKKSFEDVAMNDATVKSGSSLRIAGNTMYFLEEGNTVLQANDKLINANVTRDTNGYFTASPAFVKATLKEAVTLDATSNLIADGNTLYAKDTTTETFYTANYRVTANVTEANNAYTFAVDERHMVKFNVADYFSSGTVEAMASPSTHAFGEVIDKELIIYAGTTSGQSTVTFTNGTNNVTFNVTHDANGKVSATAQTAVNTLLFSTLDLASDAGIEIAPSSYNSSIVDLVKTADGVAIYPKALGLTSFALTKDGNVIRLVNIKVENDGGSFKVTPTPVTFTADGSSLFTTLAAEQVGTTNEYYVKATGNALYGVADTTQITAAKTIIINENEENGY